ncbi:MAG: S9 family peptidase [Gemmataceae bacterium]|nr:S9 family peptidase [Gemmataceae bacterium]MDW8265826.1 S9 family peptidase [Gemmataceae bacterium]
MKLTVLLLTGVFLAASCAVVEAAGKRPMTLDDLFRFQRLSDPQLSPDGRWVAYVVTTVDLAGNSMSSCIWLVPTDGGEPRQLTNTTKKDRHPRWSPDGRSILFESNRSGDNQLWIIDIDGGEARQVTNIATEASNGIWSPDGRWIAFVSAVWPEFSHRPYAESNAANKKKKEEIDSNPVKAKVFTKLFFRHWDEYVGDKRQHLFVMPVPGRGSANPAEPRDVTPGDRDAYPTSSTFSVGDDFTFSPDSRYLVFTAVPEKDEAWSTNYDLCRVPITGGAVETLTRANPAADGAPRFSPDGAQLAYRAQRRAGFEADRWEIMVVPTDPSGAWRGEPRSVTASLDRSVDSFVWGADNRTIYFLAEEHAATVIFQTDTTNGQCRKTLAGRQMQGLSISRDGTRLAFVESAMDRPAEVFVYRLGAPSAPTQLSHANDALLAQLDLPRPESVTVPGAGGTPMQMWILKPPGFDPAKKWPVAYLVHGGPQGAWEDGWSYRWNAELWAAQGYIVALPNPRGSTGFGQKYVDEISGDWGGKCFEDLMAGVAYLEKLPYVDPERLGAAGASFGGYMMNFFQGNTTKFKTLITHCGVYNFDSMYALTDELWFDEWEHGGPPWLKRDSYEKHSPHKFAKNFKTPMLIIHNDLDFRVPVAEGIQLFTTLQRLGVPSRFVNFPDEGHWVLKPKNSEYWHKEVFAWLAKYVPPGGR